MMSVFAFVVQLFLELIGVFVVLLVLVILASSKVADRIDRAERREP